MLLLEVASGRCTGTGTSTTLLKGATSSASGRASASSTTYFQKVLPAEVLAGANTLVHLVAHC